ncbi:metallopeptidase family M24 [Streptomyces sp. CG 926]|uniref:aminopeptidase P family protein n=1 Tax=Streptomyces sp. CG 926 TaxID=1882405 RepID=UPI000D7B51AA|nr:aminopeptidase P family protein [Streptomyces sp. CG 926]PWK71241.1 metallopeptidase family M24 [Streptomyces sp. CG 926]
MSVPDRMDERLSALGLVEAQRMAEALFAGTATRGLVAPGRSEREASDRIGDLARDLFGTAAGLPGPIVRSGPHTLLPYGPAAPDRVIGEDDVVVAELGSVLAVSEVAFASTLVFGQDPAKHRLAMDLPRMFTACREALLADSRLTGGRLHTLLLALAAESGWTVGGWHSGHLVGADPSADVRGARPAAYICAENDRPLRRAVEGGWQAHWILEIHLVDGSRGFGGSYKRLLDLV